MNDDQRHKPEEALRLIKEARMEGGSALTKEQAVKFVTRRVWMGWPTPAVSSSRGPKPTRTQYGEAYKRRRDLYRRWLIAPNARRGKGNVKASDCIKQMFRDLIAWKPTFHYRKSIEKRRNLVKELQQEYARLGRSCPFVERTLRRILKEVSQEKGNGIPTK